MAGSTFVLTDRAAERRIDERTRRILAWTVASPETYELLVERAGYSHDAYEQWLTEILLRAIVRASCTGFAVDEHLRGSDSDIMANPDNAVDDVADS